MQGYFDAVIADILSPAGGSGKDSDRAAYPPVLLAVSGGIDSMCMADLVLHSHHDLDFAVAHCNFHLRGEESDSDTAFVKDWCSVNGVRIHVADFDTAAFASGKGMSIEMAARELRYGWFRSLCLDHGYAGVFVAHNANDNAETLILNLLRGTGLRGLSGMGKVSANPCGSDTCVYRPLLDFTRKQIEGYVRARGILYHDDSTNADSSYRRNRIRNEVFPIFEKINPSFIKTLNREAGYFAMARGLVEELVQRSLPDSGVDGRHEGTSMSPVCGEARLGIESLVSCSHWPYLLYMFLERYGFNSAAIASVERLLKESGKPGTTLSGKSFLSGTHILVTTSSELIVRPISVPLAGVDEAVQTDACHGSWRQHGAGPEDRVEVGGPGTYRIGGREFSVEVKPAGSIHSLKCPRGTVMFDISRLPFPFVCRRWRAGDWLVPFGMRGRKKVSDLFTDLKLDVFSKTGAIMLVRDYSDSHVAAVLGERIDDSLKVTPASSEVAVITLS